ncbi:MAG: carbon starvation CstA family protein, partial [Mucinivorans sp.]
MYSFLIGIALLIVGYFTYGLLIEKVLKIDPKRVTPAYKNQDGVDFVP